MAGVGISSGAGRAVTLSILLLLSVFAARSVQSQQIDMLLKGGHVIDPRNGIDATMDVAIASGRIVQVARDIPVGGARRVVDVTGLYVTPGIVDLHCHLEEGAGGDGFTFRAGVTTCVDAGSYGWRNYQRAQEQMEALRTRWYIFLAITGEGLTPSGGTPRELLVEDYSDYNPVMTAAKIRQFPDEIVGIKVWKSPDFWGIEQAVEAGRLANVPVMIDFGSANPPLSLDHLLNEVFRPGDIYTHAFAYHPDTRESIVDENFRVKPYVLAARERGIIFDIGHGGGAFGFPAAIPAMEQGFFPDVISTDLHRTSMNDGAKDMANVMSKFLNMAMPLQKVIEASTWKPAQVISKEDEVGHLSVGAEADVAVFRVREGDFGFLDVRDILMKGDRMLEAELTLLRGRIEWDRNGMAGTPYVAPE